MCVGIDKWWGDDAVVGEVFFGADDGELEFGLCYECSDFLLCFGGGVDAQDDAAEVFSHASADGGAVCLVGYVAGETDAVFAFACPVGALGADEVVEGGDGGGWVKGGSGGGVGDFHEPWTTCA